VASMLMLAGILVLLFLAAASVSLLFDARRAKQRAALLGVHA
jgi:sec-independent protein translocase protein TatC